MKKAAIYDPYLDTLGGGERYCLTVAEILSKNGYHVDLLWDKDSDILNKAETRFSLDLSSVKITNDFFKQSPTNIDLFENDLQTAKKYSKTIPSPNLLQKITNFLIKYKNTQKYDLIFFLSDGSIPLLFSKKNFLHLQVPFHYHTNTASKIKNKIKFLFISKTICNSKFTQKFIEKYYDTSTFLLYPPVDIEKLSSDSSKENIILSVGRFDNVMNAKKQDILIDAFKKINHHSSNKNWKLVLAGGSLQSIANNSYLNYLKNKSQGLPIDFIINPSFDELKIIYQKSKIYWHAAGYDVDQDIQPEFTEHFGMTVVEAMASGAVPIVVNKGGLPEIISDNIDGFLWNNIDELVSKTNLLIASPKLLSEMQIASQKKSKQFSKDNFQNNFLKLL